MAEIRTFLAIPLSTEIKRKAERIIRSLKTEGIRLRWTAVEQMHLTLCFLGNIEDRRVPEACHAIDQVLQSYGPLDLSLASLGGFPSIDRARVIWIGVDEGHETLIEMQRDLTDALCAAGFGLDRGKFHPHLTLGRSRNRTEPESASLFERFADCSLGEFPLTEITLYSSVLEKSGPIHTAMARFEL